MEWIGLIIGYLISGVIFGFASRAIAESKGYEGGFAWGFWLGIIGLLVVGFRPSITAEAQPAQSRFGAGEYRMSDSRESSGYAPKPVAKKGWTCVCGAHNPSSIDVCLSCRKTREEATEERIACPHCGAANKQSNERCFACSRPLKEETAQPAAGGEAPVSQTQRRRSQASAADAMTAEPAVSPDFSDVLKKLAQLHQEGILTDDEFSRKKAEILSRI